MSVQELFDATVELPSVLDVDVASLPTARVHDARQTAARRPLSAFEAADEEELTRRYLRRRALLLVAGWTTATLVTAGAVGVGL